MTKLVHDNSPGWNEHRGRRSGCSSRTVTPGASSTDSPRSGRKRARSVSPSPASHFIKRDRILSKTDQQPTKDDRTPLKGNIDLRSYIILGDEDDVVPSHAGNDRVIIDLDEEAEVLEAGVFDDEEPQFLRSSRVYPERDDDYHTTFVVLENYRWGVCNLATGKTAELADGTFLYIKQILRHKTQGNILLQGLPLIRSTELSGMLPKKANELCFIYEQISNDPRPSRVQALIETDLDSVTRLRILRRVNLPFPQARFNPQELPGMKTEQERKLHIREQECLVARWVMVTTYECAADRIKVLTVPNCFQSRLLRSLDKGECQKEFYISPSELKLFWRGVTIPGGSGTRQNRQQAVQRPPVKRQRDRKDFDHCCDFCDEGFTQPESLVKHHQSIHEKGPRDSAPGIVHKESTNSPLMKKSEYVRRKLDDIVIISDNESGAESFAVKAETTIASTDPKKEISNRRYTYGDAYCGAGGMTRGAVMADLEVRWGMDFNKHASETWRKNFLKGTIYNMSSDEFVALDLPEDLFIVDVLHLSPPCQVFSPAHTSVGKDDDMNFASLFGVLEIVRKSRPRVVTLEQTFGILHKKCRQAFNSVVQMFTSLGFNISWQIVELKRFGLAQRRKRLIILASCPGEELPDLPPFTHSEFGGNGLKPFTTPRSLLDHIPRTAGNHDFTRVYNPAVNYKVWDANKITNTITCNGGENASHPSGKRGLTIREFASLQGFPLNHTFHGDAQRKQIGNAVPPMIGKVLLSWIRKHLERIDGVVVEVEAVLD